MKCSQVCHCPTLNGRPGLCLWLKMLSPIISQWIAQGYVVIKIVFIYNKNHCNSNTIAMVIYLCISVNDVGAWIA